MSAPDISKASPNSVNGESTFQTELLVTSEDGSEVLAKPQKSPVSSNQNENELANYSESPSTKLLECDEECDISQNICQDATPHVTFDVSSCEIVKEQQTSNSRILIDEKIAVVSDTGNSVQSKACGWGWLVVASSWIVMIPIAGMLSSFGAIVSSLASEFNATKLETGWIGSLAFSFTVGTCPVSTPLFTVFGARKVALLGVTTGSISILVTSFVPTVYLMFLTYSTMFGISANFVYNSAMTLTGQYFPSKNQALATCLASAGISFGTLLMNPFTQFLTSEIGWRHALRVLSGMILLTGLLCVSVFKPVKTPEQKVVTKLKHTKKEERDEVLEFVLGSHKELDKQAITESLQNCNESKISLAAQEIKKNVFDKRMYDCSVCSKPAFILWMLGTLFWSLSFLFPVIFIIDYMESIEIAARDAALVMTAYGIAEFVGRVVCAAFADRINFSLAYVYGVSCTFMGIVTVLAPQGPNLVIMFLYGACIGSNSGILNSLMFTTTMQLFGNEKGPHVWGYINVMLALGMVIGPVTAGGIYDITKSYDAAFYMGGAMFVLAAITMSLIPVSQQYFAMNEIEANGQRKDELRISIADRIVKHRLSLRTSIMTKQFPRRQSSEGKWKGGATTYLKELNELQEACQVADKNEDNMDGLLNEV